MKLSKEETTTLCEAIKNGCPISLDKMIRCNMGLVQQRAYRFLKLYKPSTSVEDLIQEGCIGLLKACYKYDGKFNNTFGTYAVYWIDQEMKRSKFRFISIPEHKQTRMRFYAELVKQVRRGIDFEEALEASTLTKEEYALYSSIQHQYVSLDTPTEHPDVTLENVLPTDLSTPEEFCVQVLQKEDLRQALLTLNPLDRKCITLRYGLNNEDPMTYRGIAKELGWNRSSVNRSIEDSLKKLKQLLSKL